MKPLVAIALAMLAACFVHKKSSDFTCSDSSECSPDRTCDQGFCIPQPIDAAPDAPECPFVGFGKHCTSCDLVAMTCDVECSTPGSCTNIMCPSGFDCTIRCSKNSACSGIDCSAGASCAIDCTVGGACDSITCGPGACDVTCSNNACNGPINCGTACSCDVSCPNGGCGVETCPMSGACTSGGHCSSTAAAGCNTCP